MAIENLRESVILMQRTRQNFDIIMVKYAILAFENFFLKDRIQLSSHYLIILVASIHEVCSLFSTLPKPKY